MDPKIASVILGYFLLQTVAIGLLPLLFNYNGLKICSIGSISYGLYGFVLPHRMIVRLQPQGIKPNSLAELCIKDIIRAWAMFCIALGAMGVVIAYDDENDPSKQQQVWSANCVFFVVGIVSLFWDYHLMISRHWGAEKFLFVNMAANTAICIASGTGMYQLQHQVTTT